MTPFLKYMHPFVPKLFRTLRDGYTLKDFHKDVMAGLTVAIVALPLSMALAIASGASPDKGLFTSIVGGLLVSIFGGSRFQISGATGSLVVVVFNIIEKFGYDGLIVATLMAGSILIVAGFLRLGSFVKYVPYPVIMGFTTGLAVVIFSSQIKDLFGLEIDKIPSDFVEKWGVYFSKLSTFNAQALLITFFSLAVIFLIRRFKPKYPAFLFSVVLASFVVYFCEIPIDTIGSKFGGLPNKIPAPYLPDFSFELVKLLFPSAITIAFLVGIESLLSAVVADGMSGDRHLSNCELVAEGLANIFCVIFGGLPASGALLRTATNIRAGAYSSVAGILHALILLMFVYFFSEVAKFIPLASLAALLMIVCWNMCDFKQILHLIQSPVGDRLTLIVTFFLTVFVDINLAIQVGVVMSCLIFMHRMSKTFAVESNLKLSNDDSEDLFANDFVGVLPEGVLAFRISGPLFFGAASQLTDFFASFAVHPKVIILRMGTVPMIDATAVNILMIFISKCRKINAKIIICNAKKQPRHILKWQIIQQHFSLSVLWSKDFDKALLMAKEIVQEPAIEHL